MGGIVTRIRGYSRDIKLFLLFNILIYIGYSVFQLIFNLYLYELRLREDYIGAFNAIQTMAMAGAALTMGRLLNRYGTWRCMTVAVGFVTVVALALALTRQPAVLLVLSALFGAGLTYLFTTLMPFIIDFGRRDQRQEVAAIAFSLISVATTIGSLVGGFAPSLVALPFPTIAPSGMVAYRLTLICGAVIIGLSAVPLWLMVEARRPRQPVDHAAARAAESAADRRQARRDLSVYVLVGGLMSLGAGMVIPFYNVYLTTLGADAAQVGYVFALGSLCAAIIGLGAPALGRRLGSLNAVLWIRLAIVPFYALLIVIPNYGFAIIAHLIRMTSTSLAWPLESTFITEVLPPRARSEAFGLRSSAWNFGYSAATLAAGGIIVYAGYGWPFASFIAFSAISAILFVGYYGRQPHVRSGQIPSALPLRRRAARVAAEAEQATAG